MDILAQLPAALATPEAGLWGLLLASFLAATLLPGGSEALLAGLLLLHPEQLWPALALATLGNTAGGMSTYALARLLPAKVSLSGTARRAQALARLRHHGAPLLLLAWLPLVGDLLCAAAGWLRLPWPACALWMGLGKAARYAAVAWGVGAA